MERLKRSLLYTYGTADMFFILMVSMELYYFTAFLTDYASFSMKTVSVILYVTGVLDIACALLAGIILEKTNLRFGGKYRSWFLLAPPIIAPLYVLQFTRVGSEALAATVIVVGFLASHLLWNISSTAGGAMVGRMSRRADEVTILSASRTQGMMAAGLVFSLTGLPLIAFFTGLAGQVSGFTLTVAVYALLNILGYLYVFKLTSGKDPYDPPAASAEVKPQITVREIVRLVFLNRPLAALIVAEIFRNSCISLVAALAFYYFSYVLRDLPFMSVFLLATAVMGLAGSIAAAWIGLRIGKRHTYWLSLLLAAGAYTSARFLGGTAWSFTALFGIGTMFTVIASSMSTALFSDTVVYGEWKTGKSIRAFTMSLLNLPIKVGVLVRSAVVTLGLVAIGFVSNAAPEPEVLSGIAALMTFSPAAVCVLAAVCCFFGYRLEEGEVERMQLEIAARSDR